MCFDINPNSHFQTNKQLTQKEIKPKLYRDRDDSWWETQKTNTKTYQPKVKTLKKKIIKKNKIHQPKVELQERIKNLEEEIANHFFFGREYRENSKFIE